MLGCMSSNVSLAYLQVHLSGSQCCRVRQLDYIGFTSESVNWPIGYVFNTGATSSYSTIVNQTNLPETRDVLQFLAPALPYEFALSAAYDTGITTHRLL